MDCSNFDIIDALEKARPPTGLFNQYALSCDIDFFPTEGAELRRERLVQHLSCEPRAIILIGDADMSAKLTGIAMTSEEQITDGYVPRVHSEQITSHPNASADWRSNLLWDELELRKIADRTIFWAAQPFYTKEHISSKKRNVPLELNYGLQFLAMLLSRHKGVPILASGAIAASAMSLMGIRPAAHLPFIKDVEHGQQQVKKAVSFLMQQPKHSKTRNTGKHVRDFFASCRS